MAIMRYILPIQLVPYVCKFYNQNEYTLCKGIKRNHQIEVKAKTNQIIKYNRTRTRSLGPNSSFNCQAPRSNDHPHQLESHSNNNNNRFTTTTTTTTTRRPSSRRIIMFIIIIIIIIIVCRRVSRLIFIRDSIKKLLDNLSIFFGLPPLLLQLYPPSICAPLFRGSRSSNQFDVNQFSQQIFALAVLPETCCRCWPSLCGEGEVEGRRSGGACR